MEKATLSVTIEKDLRTDFATLCKSKKITQSEAVSELIKWYVFHGEMPLCNEEATQGEVKPKKSFLQKIFG